MSERTPCSKPRMGHQQEGVADAKAGVRADLFYGVNDLVIPMHSSWWTRCKFDGTSRLELWYKRFCCGFDRSPGPVVGNLVCFDQVCFKQNRLLISQSVKAIGTLLGDQSHQKQRCNDATLVPLHFCRENIIFLSAMQPAMHSADLRKHGAQSREALYLKQKDELYLGHARKNSKTTSSYCNYRLAPQRPAPVE